MYFTIMAFILVIIGTLLLVGSWIMFLIRQHQHRALSHRLKLTIVTNLEILAIYELCAMIGGLSHFINFIGLMLSNTFLNWVITLLMFVVPVLLVRWKRRKLRIALVIIEILCLMIAVLPALGIVGFLLSPCM